MPQDTLPHSSDPCRIDLDAVLDAKLGSKARWVPQFAIDWLKRTVHQEELNEILSRYPGVEGAEFCDAMLREFGLDIEVRYPCGVPDKDDRRVIIVSNHPLGGLDGIALISWATKFYGVEPRFVVNDILMAVKPLRRVFIPVNKHGAQSRESLKALDEEMAGDRPIIIFPAGLVSRMRSGGEIRDLKWNKMFVTKALQFHRDVVPVHFGGHNSDFFYKLALWRKRLFVPFNIEMLYLPDELMRSRSKHFTVTVCSTIGRQAFTGERPAAAAKKIKHLVYSLN